MARCSTARGSRYQLEWFGRDGTPRGTLGPIDQYIGLRLSPDGREVLVTIRDTTIASGDPWTLNLASGDRTRVTLEDSGWYGVWSPDSQQVAFTAVSRREVLNAKKTRGAGEVQNLLTFDAQVYPSDWSLDGKYLAYATNSPGTSMDVWLLAMTGARKPAPLLRSIFAERHAHFSSDGRWLAFTSNETGRDDVYVQSFPNAAIRRLVQLRPSPGSE
jgi:Tol biopolymer transport system component